MSLEQFESVVFSSDALLAYTVILTLFTSVVLLHLLIHRGSRFTSWLLIVILSPALWVALFLLEIALPYPPINEVARYRFYVAVLMLCTVIAYRLALPRLSEFKWMQGRLAHLGMFFIFVALAISTAYYVSSRSVWTPDAFAGPTKDFMSQPLVFYPDQEVQFIFAFPEDLQTGEAGIVEVGAMTRADGPIGGLSIPYGWLSARLISPDYNVDVMDASEHTTQFVIERAPYYRDGLSVVYEPLWSWIVRPKSTGAHILAAQVFFSGKPQSKNDDSEAVRSWQWTRYEYVQNRHAARANIADDSFADNAIERKFPLLIANEGARVNVPSALKDALTPWIALLSGIAGVGTFVVGALRREKRNDTVAGATPNGVPDESRARVKT